MFGLSWEMCQGALENSLIGVDEGLPASWPSGLQCANETYTGPGGSYSHIVSLPEGDHTLWAGVVPMSAFRSRGWLGGWIHLVEILGPVFPNPPDK